MTREEIALHEVGRTDIGRGTARALIAGFLLVILAVPGIEIVGQIATARRAGASLADAIAALPLLALVRHPPALADFTFPVHRANAPERNPLHDAERAIEDASPLRTLFQTRAQSLLTRAFGTGNSSVVGGVDDWLFYRPGIDYLAGPGFLSEANRRVVPRRQPDPRPAMRAFARACADAGARLLIVPMPDKAMIHPAKLVPCAYAPFDNPDYDALVAGLAADGIEVWSPGALLAGLAERGEVFLHQDTHWTPMAMDAVAAALATRVALPAPTSPRGWTVEHRDVSRVGDLVDTLKLMPTQAVFAPQTVAIDVVRDADGAVWQPSRDADVLLLGDSFTNIYSAPQMGWGGSAGFAAHLALHLGREVDVIAINGGGAGATRIELARQPDRLGGKRLVIWQFSARDLAVSDWPVVEMPAPHAAPVAAPGGCAIEATIVAASRVAPPGGLPYADALTTLKVRVDRVTDGAYAAGEALIVVPCMRAYTLLPAASLRVGDRIAAHLAPWSSVEAREGQTKRYDDTDEFDLPQMWAATVERR